MSIIKCPECRQKISSLAITCPHCGVSIRGMIRQCPQCKTYVMKTETVCPECSCALPPTQDGQEEGSGTGSQGNGCSAQSNGEKPTGGKTGKSIATSLTVLLFLGMAAVGSYLYLQQQNEIRHEEECYARLEKVCDPEYYRQFLTDFPQSRHSDEIRRRMEVLIKEDADWKTALSPMSRNSIATFIENHPESNRCRICENMLDSIDWEEAIKQESLKAIDTYLTLHPEGLHVTEAACKKNKLAMAKITPEDKALVRGALETFLNNGMGKQDTAVIRQCIAADMDSFCGTPHATPAQIAAFAQKKMEKDIIGLHYLTGADMDIRRQSMPDSSLGFSVEFTIDETMARKDPARNTERHYRASALLNTERKIIKLTIR